jgi:hypothetical protein
MPLTSKELSAIEDQLKMEQVVIKNATTTPRMQPTLS